MKIFKLFSKRPESTQGFSILSLKTNLCNLTIYYLQKVFFRKGYRAWPQTVRILRADMMNRPVFLYAQITALDFYLKNGFEAVGETFYEAGIEHVKMILLIPEKKNQV